MLKHSFKRILSLLLVLFLMGSMLPAVQMHSHAAEKSEVLTDEDYALADAVFAQIHQMEDSPAKKNATTTQLTDAAVQIVMNSANYVEGSLERNGNCFTWWTDEGIHCVYNPRMRRIYNGMEAPADPEPAGIYNAPKTTKGGWPAGNQVYLIAPYYGIDSSFTDQYKNEAQSIASAIGDTDGYTLCSGTAVTIDVVADAMENGAVVIFDSHGTTDYDGKYIGLDPDGYEVWDYVSGANYSYLCLTSTSGLTHEDYADGILYGTDEDGYPIACINGAAIANHMDKNSPGGLLWMAICLGMATNTICEPMRSKGVEVVYGYSQSVTFAGDYCFEETFWDNMIAGKTVAQSVAAMKSKWGNWDWSYQMVGSGGYSTIADARQYRAAFPIVVSDEDTHPGQRDSGTNYGACSLQTVQSTYTLYSQYTVSAQVNNSSYGSVSVNGQTITATPATGYFVESATVISGSATATVNGNTISVSAGSDCVVQVNFAPKTQVSVSFVGANVAAVSGYAGDPVALPKATAPDGYTFVGWLTAPLSADTTTKPTCYTDSIIPTGNTTLYALYSYQEKSADGGSGDYVKVTSTPADWTGEYLIVYESKGLILNGSLSTLDAKGNVVSVSITNNTISAEQGDPYKFTIAAMSGGYSIQAASGQYMGGKSGSNTINTSTTALKNTLSIDASGNATIISNTSHLRFNKSDNRFRYYKSTSYSAQEAISIFVKEGSAAVTYYTSTLCAHANTQSVAAIPATCTTPGQQAGVICSDCQTVISGCQVIEAPGHTMGAGQVTTPATCTTAGVMSYACTVCGQGTTQSIPATGHNYTANGLVYTCSGCGASYQVSASTTLQYIFSKYTAGMQYAQGEEHTLDDAVTLIVNGGHLNTQLRLYAGSNAVFAVNGIIESVTVKAGYKVGTLTVYGSEDGDTWTSVKKISTTTSYTNYKVDMPTNSNYRYLKLEATGAQIRVSEMSLTFTTVCNHSYTPVVTPATLALGGYTTYTCSCGDHYVADYTPALAQVETWGVTLDDSVQVVFNVVVDASVQSMPGAKIVATVGEGEYQEITTVNLKDFAENTTTYPISLNIGAAQMGDIITVQVLTDTDAGVPKTYSVLQYAQTILGDAKYAQYHALVKEMLSYGAAAQLYFGYKTQELVSDVVDLNGTAAQALPTTAPEIVVDGEISGLQFQGATLVFREKIALRYYFITDGSMLFGGDNVTYVEDNRFYVEMEFMPYELSGISTLTLSDGQGNELAVTYSPMNYIVRMGQNGSQSLQTLLKALYNYHLQAQQIAAA